MQTSRVSRSVVIGGVLVLALIGGLTLAGQQRSGSQPTLKGVWRVTETRRTGPNARVITSPQPWFAILTDKHFAFVGVTSDGPRPELPPPDKRTDKQVADALLPYVGTVGTYEISSGELTNKNIATLNPNLMRPGSFSMFTYKLDGDIMTLTQKANIDGPFANPVTWKWVRVE